MAVLMDEKILVLLGAEGVGLTPLVTCVLVGASLAQARVVTAK